MSVHLKRWSRQEYDRMIDAGVFAPETRVELIEGDIVEMALQNPAHATAIHAATEVLRTIFGAGYTVRTQLPLVLGNNSEPEPDVAVVRGNWRDFAKAHPTTAELVVEISDSSLEVDRVRKAPLYARAGIPEYWLVNLPDRLVEVYRNPSAAGYPTRQILRPGEAMTH